MWLLRSQTLSLSEKSLEPTPLCHPNTSPDSRVTLKETEISASSIFPCWEDSYMGSDHKPRSTPVSYNTDSAEVQAPRGRKSTSVLSSLLRKATRHTSWFEPGQLEHTASQDIQENLQVKPHDCGQGCEHEHSLRVLVSACHLTYIHLVRLNSQKNN